MLMFLNLHDIIGNPVSVQRRSSLTASLGKRSREEDLRLPQDTHLAIARCQKWARFWAFIIVLKQEVRWGYLKTRNRLRNVTLQRGA